MNRTRKNRIKGGRLIGQGSYGCVFYEPPLKCKDESSRNTRKVISKLMNPKDLDEEYSHAEAWKKLDPEQEYYITPVKKCDLDTKDIKPKNEINKCELKKDISKKKLLFYNFGGKDLEKLIPNPKTYIQLFKGFHNLLEGVAKAHQNNLFHLDIKEPNIVVDDNNKMRLIDFGLSIDTNNLNSEIDLDVYATPYWYWPYELQFLVISNITKKGIENSYNTFYNNNLLKIPYAYTQGNYFEYDWQQIDINEFYEVVKKTQTLEPKDFFQATDIFSLGVVLSRIIHRYFSHVFGLNYLNENEIKIEYPNNKRYFISEIDDDDDNIDWHKTIARKITQPLLELSQQMTQLDFTNRPSVKTVADKYKTFFNAFETHLKPKDVYNNLKDFEIFKFENGLPDFTPTPNALPPKIPTPPKEPTPKVEPPKEPTPKVEPPKEPTPKEEKKNENIPISKLSNVSYISEPSPVTIPKTSAELKKIYYETDKLPTEDSKLVQIARLLGSRLKFVGKTRITVVNDIMVRALKQGIDLRFKFK